ncbi:unnamed protein product [Closterium sp. NIES-54]
MAITICFIATSLPDHLASVHDALLLKHPSELTISALESALKDGESNLRSVVSASGAVPPPLFDGCTVPQLPTFTTSLTTAATDVTAAAVTTSSRSRNRSGRRGGQGVGGGGRGGVASGGGGSAGFGGAPHAAASDSPAAAGGGDAWVRQAPTGLPAACAGVAACALLSSLTPFERPNRVDGPAPDWLPFLHSHGAALWGMSASELLDLLETPHAMYPVVDSGASDSIYSSVFSLGASVAEVPVASVGTCVDTSPGAAPEDASLSFTLDSGTSHCFFRDHMTLTPLPAPVSVALADPTSGLVTDRYTTTLPCPAVPSGFLTSFHVPSFSRNLVGVRLLVHSQVGVWIEPFGDTATCVDGDTYAPLATFHAEPGSGLYTLHTGPQERQQQQLPPTPFTAPRQMLAHPTVLYHHHLGHPSIPRLRTMASQRLVLGLPRVLPSLLPSLAPPCAPCVEGWLRATPHSSSLRPATEPFETLHLDVRGPTSRPGLERESFILVVIDDYSRYTTVFPLAKKSEVTSMLVWWLLTTANTRGRRVTCLHSDHGGEFHSGVLAGFCREQGIRQSWTLLESPHQNGVDERRMGLVMDIALTSMIHARAPYFMWPYAVSSPSPQSSSQSPQQPSALPPQATADPEGAGFRSADPVGATCGGVGVGAESVPPRGSGAGGAGVGADPGGATTGGDTTGGAGVPPTGPRETGIGRVAAGGAGSGGGATGALESGPGATTAPDTTPPPYPYPTRHQARVHHAHEEQLELEREGRELERQQLELQQLEERQQAHQQEQQQQPQQEQPKQQPLQQEQQ